MDEQNGLEEKAKEAMKKFKKWIVRMIIQALASIFSSVGGLIFLAIIILIILVGVNIGRSNSLYNSTIDGENAGAYGRASRLVRINNSTRQYEIDSEAFIEYVNEFLRLNNLTASGIGLSEDYSELRKFLEAEISTSFPDLREEGFKVHPIQDNETQGCIIFWRKDKDGHEREMEYMPYPDFSRRMAEMGVRIDDNETQPQIYTTYGQLEEAYNNIKNYFTIDSEGNVYFAASSAHTVQAEFSAYAQEENYYHKSGRESEMVYNVTFRKFNYQDNVEKYSMPFEFLMALQVITKNSGYTKAVADMAKNSWIYYEIQENVVNTEEVIKYNWTSHFRYSSTYHAAVQEVQNTSHIIHVNMEKGPVDGLTVSTNHVNLDINNTDFYEKLTISDTETTLNPAIVYVDSWIAYVNAEYTNEQPEPETEPVRIDFMPSEDWQEFRPDVENVLGIHGFDLSEVSNYNYNVPNGYRMVSSYARTTYKIEEKREQIRAEHYRTVTQNNYEPPEEMEIEENVEKFLSLLAVDPELIDEETGMPIFNVENVQANEVGIIEYEGLNQFKSKPIYTIINDRRALVYMLERTQKTEEIAETMDYLIKIMTGEVEVDRTRRSRWRPTNPYPGGGSGGGSHYGNSVVEKIYYAVIDAGYSECAAAGVCGYCWGESSYSTTAVNSSSGAYGICQWLGDRKTNLIDYANQHGISPSDLDFQIDYMIAEITGSREYGSTPQYMSGYNEPYQIWKTVDDSDHKGPEDAEHGFLRWFGRPATTQSAVLNFPRQSGREAEARAVYERFHGQSRGTTPTEDESSIVSTRHTSTINGRTFVTYKQGSSLWPGQCNRCAAASIISGYFNGTAAELITSYNSHYRGTSVSQINQTYNYYGLSVTGQYYTNTSEHMNNRKNLDINNVRNQLKNGGYMQIWVCGGWTGGDTYRDALGTTGSRWTGYYHWIAIIDYKVVNGKEYIFVSNSGNWNNTGEALNEGRTNGQSGWYPINEFSTTNIVCAELYIN